MAITGLMLWFDNTVIGFLPKGFLDIALVVHYWEAWLATLAIIVWHLYSTVFSPGVYPMNPAWITGRMPEWSRARAPGASRGGAEGAGPGAAAPLAMDIRLASETARFGFVFARRGIVPEACSSWFLPRLVGISTATEWCYTGRVFPAAEAVERGLVRSVHAPDDLLPAARTRPGDRRQHGAGLGGARPADVVADARAGGSPDGGTPCRFPRDPVARCERRQRGRASRASSRSVSPAIP